MSENSVFTVSVSWPEPLIRFTIVQSHQMIFFGSSFYVYSSLICSTHTLL